MGMWDVGVPPSGPMDERSFRLANRVVGNPEETAALEMTARGATLRFNVDHTFALVGARMKATLDGIEIANNVPVEARAGQVLTVGAVHGPGLRTYLAVRGGFDVPEYLGSRATFILGGFGGHATGALKVGDVLHLGAAESGAPRALSADETPDLTHDWRLGVIYGPHGAPDFFVDDDIATLFSAEYEVHFNSARTGVRLTGPKPKWARPDGGDKLIPDGQARPVAGTNSPGMIWVQAIRFENHPSAGPRHRTEFIFVFSFSKTSAGSVGCLRKQRLCSWFARAWPYR